MKNKKFDCVKMKNDIQRKMLEEEKAIGKDAYKKRMENWLETSTDHLAVWWRNLSRGNAPNKIVYSDRKNSPLSPVIVSEKNSVPSPALLRRMITAKRKR